MVWMVTKKRTYFHILPRTRPLSLGRGGSAVAALDELLGEDARLLVRELLGGRLHEVGAGARQRSRDAPVQGQLAAADGIDDDSGGVRAVPDLQLRFQVQWHFAEARALHPDVAPLAVLQPGDVVAGADVDVSLRQLVLQLRGNGAGLGDLLGHES